MKHLLRVLAVASLLAGACGARLTRAQISALNASSGSGGASDGAGGSGVAAGIGAGTNDAGSGVSGSGANASSAAASRGGGQATTGRSGSGGSGSPTGSSTPGLSVASSVCSGPANGPGVSGSEVDVGTVTTLTGPVPGLFASALRGINAFAAYLNSVGGICGRKMVVKSADDNLDASQNATATQSIVGSVFALVGTLSGVDQGGAPVIQSSGIPDVGEALSTQRFNLSNNFSPMPQGIGADIAPFVYFKQKYPDAASHMAVLALNQATDVAETRAEQQGLESIGYNFVYSDYNIELTQNDFSVDAQQMKAHNAQGLIMLGIGPYYADVARAIQNAGLKMALPDYSQNAYDAAFLADAGSAANGTILWSELAMYQGEDAGASPTIALFDKWYKAVSGGANPDQFAAWGWMSGMLFVDGLNAGGGLTRASLLDGLRKVTSFDSGGFQTAANPVSKTPPACYVIIDVVNQKFVRDPVNPSGFNCIGAPNFYTPKG